MKKNLFLIGAVSIGLAFTSCKEVPVGVVLDDSDSWDTSYVSSPEVAQSKNILFEELTGVSCINCPKGTKKLEELANSTKYKGKLVIVGIHAGSLTSPINENEHQSIQDFRTTDGDQILQNIFGGEVAKPSAVVDRLKVGDPSFDIKGYFGQDNYWDNMLDSASAMFPTTPVNINITTNSETENTYTIEIRVSYTQALSGKQALSVYLTENDIEDLQLDGSDVVDYTFEHVFRKAISPFNGKEILSVMDKPAGQVFIQRYVLKIDPNDAKQKFWKPENMQVVAFVSKTGGNDMQVYQSVAADLVQ